MLSILPVLQFLVGGAPVAQRRSPCGQVEGKSTVLGVSVALLHVLLSLFCVYKSVTCTWVYGLLLSASPLATMVSLDKS